MKQVSRVANKPVKKKTVKKKVLDGKLPKMAKPMKEKGQRKHPQFGTSKLEIDFAQNFLDKLGVKYIWQFEAKEIKRFFDYYLPEHNLIIEVNGSYWHADPRLYEDGKLTRTQKHDIRVDEYKKKWALMHGIPIFYVWEKDIRENPSDVMKKLKARLYIEKEKEDKKRDMNEKRHVNKLRKKNKEK